jgi:hypothetical protein
MKSLVFAIRNDEKEELAGVYIDFYEGGDASINIRYGNHFDETFGINSRGGHYRCEIKSGIVVYEVLPKSTMYITLLSAFYKALEAEPTTENLFIRNAYSKKTNRAEKF